MKLFYLRIGRFVKDLCFRCIFDFAIIGSARIIKHPEYEDYMLVLHEVIVNENDYEEDQDSGKLVPPSCVICQSGMDKIATKLQCGHMYHSECILAWFKHTVTCPTCREITH